MRRWRVFHRAEVKWGAIFQATLQLMNIAAREGANGLELEGGAGELIWRRCWRGTKISVQLLKFSDRKQQLVVDALLKAARYA